MNKYPELAICKCLNINDKVICIKNSYSEAVTAKNQQKYMRPEFLEEEGDPLKKIVKIQLV